VILTYIFFVLIINFILICRVDGKVNCFHLWRAIFRTAIPSTHPVGFHILVLTVSKTTQYQWRSWKYLKGITDYRTCLDCESWCLKADGRSIYYGSVVGKELVVPPLALRSRWQHQLNWIFLTSGECLCITLICRAQFWRFVFKREVRLYKSGSIIRFHC
jgi:hypothetical protein